MQLVQRSIAQLSWDFAIIVFWLQCCAVLVYYKMQAAPPWHCMRRSSRFLHGCFEVLKTDSYLPCPSSSKRSGYNWVFLHQGTWVLFGPIFMFSNLYPLDLCNWLCVALVKLRRIIRKNVIEDQTSSDLSMVIGRVCLVNFWLNA